FMNLTALRHKLIAGNISNTLTPGYRSKDVDFYNEFRNSLGEGQRLVGAQTHERHLPIGEAKDGQFKITVDKSGPSNGVNNVNIDKEVTNLSINQMNYTVAARMIRGKFDHLKKAITGRQV
ncbi:MAG TPA: flagellar basal body rod protein FlgB, partial [candidate division Zixibacteria bacterium]|nr:flagellar basal body rod protein FlgB [candidate division Zixibacteria bacterium]